MGSLISSMSWTEVPVSRESLLRIYLPLLGCTYLIYSFGIKPFLSPLRKIPGLPYHPLFGNLREAMKGQAMEASIRWVAKYGGVLRYYNLLGRECVLVADPEALKRIFVTHQHKYGRPSPKTIPLGRSVLTLTGDEHRAHRLLLNPVFSPQTIKDYLQYFEEYGQRLVTNWCQLVGDSGSRINIQSDLFRMTFDVFGKAVLGQDFQSLQNPDSPTVSAFKGLLSVDTVSFTNAIPFYEYLPTSKNRKRTRCKKLVNEVIYTLMEEKRRLLDGKEVSKEEIKRDLLGCLLLARDEQSGQGLTPQQVFDELFTLIFAGYETTAMTMSWILLTLAQHPEIQQKARSEVTALLPAAGEPITWETLESMKYLDCVIKECQRLYPAASTIPRYTVEDDYLGPYFIPKGTTITCHLGTMMRSSRVWKDAETFNPDRFLDDKPGLYTFLPFGTGPTKCLGHLFARSQMKVVIALLLRQLSFDVIPGLQFRRKHRILLKAVPSIELSVKLVK